MHGTSRRSPRQPERATATPGFKRYVYSYRVRATDSAGNLSGYSIRPPPHACGRAASYATDQPRGHRGQRIADQSHLDGFDEQRRVSPATGGSDAKEQAHELREIATRPETATAIAASRSTSYTYRVRATDAAEN